MPRVTQDHLDARRRQILAAAHRCFARSGFHATTMQQIADEAGLSAGALYRYFEGKEAVIEGLAAEGRDRKRGALEGLAAEEGDLGSAVRSLLAALAEGGAWSAARLDVRLWGEALDAPPVRRALETALDSVRAPVEKHVRGRQAAGTMRRDVEAAAVARTFLSLLVGAELQKAFDPRELDVDAYAAAASALIDGLVRPLPRAAGGPATGSPRTSAGRSRGA